MAIATAIVASVLAAGPPLQVPWTCGVTKPCTQAHGGFSHTGNSLWAWDFDVNEGEEVWASSPGVVSFIRMDSMTGGCDASFGGDANYVVVDHDDGTAIVYMHLQPFSSPLQVGDAVRPGMLVGRVGLTGYVCGDHLHLMVMEQCGGPYCQSLEAAFADYGDPAEGDQIESTNCPACELALDGAQTLVSELEPGCFVRETTSWWSTMSGDDDHHFHTIATDGAEPVSIGTWRFGVSVPGDYRVEVFVPDDDADSTGAVYRVVHDGGETTVAVDQAANKGWQELGVFGFSGADGQRVWLGDDTGEAVDLDRRLAYDAVRFTFVPSSGDTTGASGDDTAGGTDDSASGPQTASASDPTADATGDSASGSASATAASGDAGTGTSDDDALPDTFGEDTSDTGGCGCASDRGARSVLLWLVVLLGWRRHRTPHRRAPDRGSSRPIA